MLDKEFEYYLENQISLVKRYDGRFIVIKNQSVVGDYDSMGTAYIESKKVYELGTFLIQFCEGGQEAYTQTFTSRIYFG